MSNLGPAALAKLARDLETGAKHPREAKEELAREITARYHGAAAAETRYGESQVFREGGLPDDIEAVTVRADQERVWLPKVMVAAGLAGGTSEGRRLISQGGVSVDGEKISDVNAELPAGGTFLLQIGKGSHTA